MPEAILPYTSPHPLAFRPACSVAILTWGDHLPLVRRCLDSLQTTLPEGHCEVVVAANAPSPAVREWLMAATEAGSIHRLLVSERNIHKCPMMRHVVQAVRGEYLWWFDDDSHVTDEAAFQLWFDQVQASSPRIVGWGATAYAREFDGFDHEESVHRWVRNACWYRGLPSPGMAGGPDVWWFLTGGCWWMRTAALRAMDWPDPRLRHLVEDILLGEAVRQQGWSLANITHPGVAFSDAERRGEANAGFPLAGEERDPKAPIGIIKT